MGNVLTSVELISTRVHGSPVMLQRKTIRVEVTRDITRTSRIAIVPPSPSDIVRFFIDSEVIVSKETFQLNCHSKTRNAPSDDDNFFRSIHNSDLNIPRVQE
jgi:hypothetical protein